MEPPDPSVAYTLTRDEYLQFIRDCILNKWAFHDYAHRIRRIWFICLLVLLALDAYLVLFLLLPSTPGRRPPVIGIALVIVAFLVSGWLFYKFVRLPHSIMRPLMRAFDRMTQSGEIQHSAGEQRITLLPEGVLTTNQKGTALVNWLFGVSRVERTPTSLLLFTAPATAIIIPTRAFASAPDAERFAAHALKLFDSRAQPSERVAAHLANRDAPCPKCSYNLRDAVGDRCPECGEPLAIGSIVRAAAARARSS